MQTILIQEFSRYDHYDNIVRPRRGQTTTYDLTTNTREMKLRLLQRLRELCFGQHNELIGAIHIATVAVGTIYNVRLPRVVKNIAWLCLPRWVHARVTLKVPPDVSGRMMGL